MKTLNKVFLLIVMALSAAMFSNFAMAQTGGKIIIVDFTRVQEESLVGQNVISQLTQYGNAVQARKEALEASLNDEGAALENQESVLPPDAFQQRVTAFQQKARQADLELQGYRSTMVRGEQNAKLQITNELKPIVNKIMGERGADLVLDKSLIYISGGGFDVTDIVISRLNAVITSYPLNLSPPTLSGPAVQ